MTDSENIKAWDFWNVLLNQYVRERQIPSEVVSWVVSSTKGRLLLEVGCGIGIWFHSFQNLGFKCEGVEQSKIACEIASHNHMDSPIYNIRIQELLANTSFLNKYDLVFSCGVLMHNIDPRKYSILDTVKKTLKSDGYFLMCENTVTDRPDDYCLSRQGWIELVESAGFLSIHALDDLNSNTWYMFKKVN